MHAGKLVAATAAGCAVLGAMVYVVLLETVDLKRYVANTDRCNRSLAVSAYTGSYSGHYYCQSVDKDKGENCIQQSWLYVGDDPEPRKRDHKVIYWNGATVEVRNVKECYR